MSNQADKVISDFISYFTQISIILKSKKEVDRFIKRYLSAGLRETIENIINDLNNPYYTIKEHIDDQRRFAGYVFGNSVDEFVNELLSFKDCEPNTTLIL
ncbi:unnamed protein product [Phytophthora lilii]|uniref:Unnamed protein product n=1 Tax=Phytophthora lilii TaxID=2077276 RepID=A0A9W6WVK0_9STRA|nr:unnamed protein product [Phytophthora lilii]